MESISTIKRDKRMNRMRQRPNESIPEWGKRLKRDYRRNQLKKFMRRINWTKLITWWGILVITFLIWSNVYSCVF